MSCSLSALFLNWSHSCYTCHLSCCSFVIPVASTSHYTHCPKDSYNQYSVLSLHCSTTHIHWPYHLHLQSWSCYYHHIVCKSLQALRICDADNSTPHSVCWMFISFQVVFSTGWSGVIWWLSVSACLYQVNQPWFISLMSSFLDIQ